MRFSLGTILALSLAGLQFIAIIIVVSTSYLTSETAMLQHARGLLAEAGANASKQSDNFLRPARIAVEMGRRMIERGLVNENNASALENFLFQNLQGEPQISGIYYGDEIGNFTYVMRSNDEAAFRTKIMRPNDGETGARFIWRHANFEQVSTNQDKFDAFDPRGRPWYSSAKEQGTTVWTNPYIFFSSQRPGISVATPVFKDGFFSGVMGVDIEIAALSSFLSQLGISSNASALILNDNRDVIAHSDISQIIVEGDDETLKFAHLSDISDPRAQAAFSDFMTDESKPVSDETPLEFQFEDQRYLSLLKPLGMTNVPWTIALFAPENDFTQSIKNNRTRNIWLAAFISLGTALVGLALAELILRPVRAFAVRTALVSQGEMSASEPLPQTYKELTKANETLIDEIAQRREADAKILELNRDLSHFSRVNLMGQMATGLAHELSQPLTAISQNVDAAITAAQQQSNIDQELLHILSELDEQAHLGGDILRALRGFVKKDPSELLPFDVNELLDQTERLMQNEAAQNDITLEFTAPDLPLVTGNRIQIAQVLINLIRNAMEAITEANSPEKQIYVIAHRKPESLEIWVEDTGPGIAEDVTLFKQFETSKQHGMGLGLSISRTIAEANAGRLWHDAAYSDRCRFCLSLPI